MLENNKYWLLFWLIGLFACQSDIAPGELKTYIVNPENGLIKKKNIGKVAIAVQYQPIDFLLAKEFNGNHFSKEEYKKRQKELDGAQYYHLKIGIQEQGKNIINHNLQDANQLQERLYYLSYKMDDDIQLIDGRDTLRPMLFHFERSYDLAPYNSFVLAFDQRQQQKNTDKTFILDIPFLGTGPIKLLFSGNSINNLPKLAWK